MKLYRDTIGKALREELGTVELTKLSGLRTEEAWALRWDDVVA